MLEKTQRQDTGERPPDGPTSDTSTWRGLSGKLLVLTIIFVMIAEVLIFVPSAANFRNVWLQSHLDTAEAASIVFLDSGDPMLSQEAQSRLLAATQSMMVAVREGGRSRLLAGSGDFSQPVSTHIDLTTVNPLESIGSALEILFFGGDETLRVFGDMKARVGTIELVQEDRHLRGALLTYSRNVLLISLAISLITAALVFLALYALIVRPIKRISDNMTAFSEQPENVGLVLRPTGRSDEIGVAERRLAAFQTDLQNTLRQKQHLANLGLAVSKINHDLRNILASAQLFSDRLSTLTDPNVQHFAPRLIRTIDRAVEYTRSVITYGKALEKPPERRLHRLRAIVEDVAEIVGLDQAGAVEWRNRVPEDLEVNCDAEQLFRVILNLCRNALQAMDSGDEGSAVRRLEVAAERSADTVLLRISDTGPGIADVVREKLFQAFQGTSTPGGTGLGLAISAELVQAHGGTIGIESTGSAGTTFLITLPDQPPPAQAISPPASGSRREARVEVNEPGE